MKRSSYWICGLAVAIAVVSTPHTPTGRVAKLRSKFVGSFSPDPNAEERYESCSSNACSSPSLEPASRSLCEHTRVWGPSWCLLWKNSWQYSHSMLAQYLNFLQKWQVRAEKYFRLCASPVQTCCVPRGCKKSGQAIVSKISLV